MRRRIGLVGGAGFIGTCLARAAVAGGHEVSVLDPVTPVVCGVDHVRFALDEVSALRRWVSRQDTVVLLAGLLAAPAERRPREAWAVNLSGCVATLDAAVVTGVERVIVLSSAMVYDRHFEAGSLSEDAATAANGLYGTAKLALEHATRAAVAAGLPAALIMRPFTVFGPGPMRGDKGHFMGRWLELALAGEPLTIHGSGLQPVDLVHVDTVAQICLKFMDEPEPQRLRILNATGGAPVSVVDLATLFQQARADVGVRHVFPENHTPLRGWGDPTAMREYLGHVPRHPLDAMRAFLADSLG